MINQSKNTSHFLEFGEALTGSQNLDIMRIVDKVNSFLALKSKK